MTILNNRIELKTTRKILRNDSTKAETLLWEELKGRKLLGYKFRRQHSIGRYIVDFYCPRLKISIELDGGIHDKQKEYDVIRTEFLQNCGTKELRFLNEEVYVDLEIVVEQIKDFISTCKI